ncbi:methyltransferase, FkbM family [Mycobacterium sp. JS623]|uniref:FkbM family methyltransferase n=1 Tax=Mycobacterium sp. JS623 TaxID=212767 RepID=UPI0002A55969|nr:FkbM family methyltransferase [Mycobacterium sp. JS623]AGB21346.1 methyltransferase, FkbM family [Mycobacterium sp. JS623]
MSNAIRSKISEALPPRAHAAVKVLKIASLTGELPFRARAQLLLHAPTLLMPSARSADFRLMLPGGPVFLSRDSFYIDALVLDYLWNGHVWEASCQDRVVLDLGAHKGYFGAWALRHGASFVISCEPESNNFRMLERTRSENARSEDWEVMRIAVGAKSGEVSLFVSTESWAHSIYEEMVDTTRQTRSTPWRNYLEQSGRVQHSVERVEMVTLATVLERAFEKRPGQPVVIKANVEGAAGPILMAATAAVLAPVIEVHIDYEPGSPYEIGELLEHLAAAGLDEVRMLDDKYWVASRAS